MCNFLTKVFEKFNIINKGFYCINSYKKKIYLSFGVDVLCLNEELKCLEEEKNSSEICCRLSANFV